MKYLSDYLNDPSSALFKKYGVFFAFSNKQYKEQANPDVVKYVRMPSGAICPEENALEFMKAYAKLVDECIEMDKADHTKEEIIWRELTNHEAYYTGDITDTVESLEDYDYSESDVLKVYKKNYKRGVKGI